MKVIGIIAEYNPFHNGHAYLIQRARELSGADAVVAVMSGDFVQRGVPAMYDKYIRTQMALAGGCDLVLELPVAAACGSAQRFAEGACAILDAIGVIDALWFGSEAGEMALFRILSKVLCEEPDAYRAILKTKLAEGCSFPRAREEALVSCLSNDSIRTFLKNPNNILGLEYCIALQKRKSSIVPCTIPRSGSGYHERHLNTHSRFSSAAAIRQFILEGGSLHKLAEAVPASTLAVLKETAISAIPVREDDFSDMLRYQLMSEDNTLTDYLDVSEDLTGRFSNYLDRYRSFSQFAELLEAKNYTRTQINRALLHILLHIRKEDLLRAVRPEYVRILGFNGQGRKVLAEIGKRKETGIQVTAKISALPEKITRTDVFASNLYEAVRSQKSEQDFVHEFSRPVILAR